MKLIETRWWSMPVGDEWDTATEEDTVIISDRDGVGSLEFTVLELEQADSGQPDLQELAGQIVPSGIDGQSVRCGAWQGLRYEYSDDDYCRDWLLVCGQNILLVGYTCDAENRGMDDAAVDQMLAELQGPG